MKKTMQSTTLTLKTLFKPKDWKQKMEFLEGQAKLGVMITGDLKKEFETYQRMNYKPATHKKTVEFFEKQQEIGVQISADMKEAMHEFYKKQAPKSTDVEFKHLEDLAKMASGTLFTTAMGIAAVYPQYAGYASLASFANILFRPYFEKFLIHSLGTLLKDHIKEDKNGKKTIDAAIFMTALIAVAFCVFQSIKHIDLKKQFDSLISAYDNTVHNCYDMCEEYIKFVKIGIKHLRRLNDLENEFNQKVENKSLTQQDINNYNDTKKEIILKLENIFNELKIHQEDYENAKNKFIESREKVKEFAAANKFENNEKYQTRYSETKPGKQLEKLDNSVNSLIIQHSKFEGLRTQNETLGDKNNKAILDFNSRIQETENNSASKSSWRLW